MNQSKNAQMIAFRIICMILVTALITWILIELRILLVSLVFALTLASAIAPLAEWGEQRGIRRVLMVMAVYLAVAALYIIIAVALVPAIKQQSINLVHNLPEYIGRVTGVIDNLKGAAGEQAAEALQVNTEMLQNLALKIGNRTIDVTASLLEFMIHALLVLFLTAYFVIEADEIWKKLLDWVPPVHRATVGALIRPLGGRMGGYVRGQLLVSIAVASFITIGLMIVGVKYSLVLGMLAGMLNLVPFVGSFIAFLFATIVAFNQSLWIGGAVLCLFALEQWVESNFIVPHLLGRQVELHPLIVFFAIMIGASLMGLPGALVAVPVASALLFLAQEFYLKTINNPQPVPTGSGSPETASNTD